MTENTSILIAAPSSGAGKTTVTLGLLRSLQRRGISVRGAKSGPDYIDPRFHETACKAPCLNLDAWAMTPARLRNLAAGPGLLIIEGAMGLFDGAPPEGRGSSADLAKHLGSPVILVVDASKMAQSITPLVNGFAAHDRGVRIAGVILNRIGSPRHETTLRRALQRAGIPVLGAIPRAQTLTHPSRHLGLVQAQERDDLEEFLDAAADLIDKNCDIDTLISLSNTLIKCNKNRSLKPPAQTISIAQDKAFAFAYPHILQDWTRAGCTINTFSPLADEPVPPCDFLFLPGGYPELYAGQLSAAHITLASIKAHAATAPVYGECGGYMLLGQGIIDADGKRHQMTGLLKLETSFAARKLHLGYRKISATSGPMQGAWNAHEFHYATTVKATGTPLFQARDATGAALPDMGLREGNASGSFAHIIDTA